MGEPEDYSFLRGPGVVNYALSLQGVPYRYGGETPAQGFDCSGFVQHVYHRQGIALPRTAHAMWRALPQVPVKQRRPGDLVFFHTGWKPYSHVGLYLGYGRFIHAASERTGRVIVSKLTLPYWRQRFTGFRRPIAGQQYSACRLQRKLEKFPHGCGRREIATR
jgi:cell wall-associated NlpC family hydrolase